MHTLADYNIDAVLWPSPDECAEADALEHYQLAEFLTTLLRHCYRADFYHSIPRPKSDNGLRNASFFFDTMVPCGLSSAANGSTVLQHFASRQPGKFVLAASVNLELTF